MSPPVPAVLSNGQHLSKIGFGTYKISEDEAPIALSAAIEAGYRHIDCAAFYANERYIGSALKRIFDQGTVKRGDIFLTTKVWPTAMRPENARKMARQSMADLGTDYLDLLLIHWPVCMQPAAAGAVTCESATGPDGRALFDDCDWIDTWKEFEAMHKEGMVRSIGVSNFSVEQMTRLCEAASVIPAVLQVESHPLLIQPKLRAFCSARNIQITAYCPLGNPGRVDHVNYANEPVIVDIARKHNKSWSDVILRWHMQFGNVVIPKSSNPARIKSNFEACVSSEFTLSGEEMAAITAMGADRVGRIVNPTVMTADGSPLFKNTDG